MPALLSKIQTWLAQPVVGPLIRVGLIVVGTGLLIFMIGRVDRVIDRVLIRRLGEEAVRRRGTITSVTRWLIKVGILTIGAFAILRELGLDLAPLLAGAGIAGIIIAFGAQNLMKDFLGGAFVVAERQYQVGDWVRMAGVEGSVERVTLRMTSLRDLSGSLHVVPNGHGGVVTNDTHTWARALLDVEVAYKEDVDRVIEVLRDIGARMRQDETWGPRLLEPMEIPGVQSLGESGVKIRIYVKTPPEHKFDAMRELRRRIKKRFDEEAIEIPFPHRMIYTREG